jgi:hypothetical protein
MNITIPRRLKEQMDQLAEQVNWSGVAAEAFQRKIVEVRSERKRTMTKAKVIERLKSAGKGDPKGFEVGRALGRKWAEEKALPRHLRNLAKGTEDAFSYRVDPDDQEQPPYQAIAYWLACAITGESLTSEDKEAFWAEAIGPEGHLRANGEDFARGFIAGALEVWEEVKDEL